ncbi:amidohydrolase family protein [Pseudoblastomonas flavescens]|uniref:amidohydrolase family protein n=1 Tax=Alteriqipengyuania flavescens TaxID=3053610 RepID=UPI00299F8D97|nr:amidohydrolase family protein [Alteriqipengyuania flavescens]
MRRLLPACLVAIAAVGSAAIDTPALAQDYVIHAGSVIADAGGEPGGPATITVSGGRIVAIGDRFLIGQGMTSREAFASATTVAVGVLGMENEIGRLAPGYSADIVAVKGNPLDDATALENVDWVMMRGRIAE